MHASPKAIAAALLVWYPQAARSLPWRSDPTPYHVLLSELMLQQTRVDTVIPYYERFLARWPTLQELGDAPLDDVLKAWAGLGYYARARNLHRCAQQATVSGGLPRTPAALRKLPGIGPYTAGAIASIAFGEPAALVDGNVERVMCRVDGRSEDPRSTPGRKALWARCDALQQNRPDQSHPGDLNQALMELGATLCTPKKARCNACPLADLCVARRTGQVSVLPNKPKRVKPVPAYGRWGVCRREDGAILMGKRPETGLLAGLWEPIGTGLSLQAVEEDELVRAFEERAGVRAEVVSEVGTVRHVFTHRKLDARVFVMTVTQGPLRCGAYYQKVAWVQADSVGLSTLAKRMLDLEWSFR